MFSLELNKNQYILSPSLNNKFANNNKSDARDNNTVITIEELFF